MADLTKKEVEVLAEKKLLGTITPEENALLQSWLSARSEMQLNWNRSDKDEAALKEKLFRHILFTIKATEQKTSFALNNFRRIAAVLVVVLTAALFIRYSSTGKKISHQLSVVRDVQPGKSGAVLTLSNGQRVSLDSAANGLVATQSNYQVVLKNGSLQYEQKADSANNNRAVAFNTVSTPIGRQFAFVLSDGTHVWLNAGSSIQYPVAFSAAREVSVTGEAYFEVAKLTDGSGSRVPFVVKTNTQQIEVLGTHFDVNAYSDEPSVKTTLLEGRVKVSATGIAPVILAPGQQSLFNAQSHSVKVKSVDAPAAAAWTRGMFSFSNAGIEEVMRQFARWYNVQVIYEAGLPKRTFSGKIYRTLTASQALDALKFMNLNFSLENTAGGMRIKVMQ